MSSRALGCVACCLLLLGVACGDKAKNAGDAGVEADGGEIAEAGEGGSEAGTSGGAGKGGAGTSSNAGKGGGAGEGSGESGSGGGDKDAGAAGPGIKDDSGEVFCLADQAVLSAAFYFGTKKQCLIYDMADGDFADNVKMNYEYDCTSTYAGTVVDACPEEGRVAYCATGPTGPTGLIQQKIVYESVVNPSAEVVARNFGVCGGKGVYDLDDQPLTTECKGTLKAKIDGKLTDFSARLTCIFKTDGAQLSYLVRGIDKLNAVDSKELTIYVYKNAGKIELKNELGMPGFGYLEGQAASGAFTTSATGETPTYTSKTLEADGSALSGSFDLGKLNGGGGATRTITEGSIDMTFELL